MKNNRKCGGTVNKEEEKFILKVFLLYLVRCIRLYQDAVGFEHIHEYVGFRRYHVFFHAGQRQHCTCMPAQAVFPFSRGYSDFSGFADFGKMFFFFLLYLVDFDKGFFKFGKGKTLGRIIRIIVKVTDKEISVLPISIFQFHIHPLCIVYLTSLISASGIAIEQETEKVKQKNKTKGIINDKKFTSG